MQGKIECGDEFVCGKCGRTIDAEDECRFYQRRGGLHDGKRMMGHKSCVQTGEAIALSPESAVHILLRQQRQRVTA